MGVSPEINPPHPFSFRQRHFWFCDIEPQFAGRFCSGLDGCTSVVVGEVVELHFAPRSRCGLAPLGGGADIFVWLWGVGIASHCFSDAPRS